MTDFLDIPVDGTGGSVRLLVYPQSSNAKVFEEEEPYAGESRWQLVEGSSYAYEFIGGRYQFERENEIVRFHPNRDKHPSRSKGQPLCPTLPANDQTVDFKLTKDIQEEI